MLGMFKRKSAHAALVGETVKQVVTTVAVKNPFYHEIAEGKVRIYSRSSGLVEEIDGGEDPHRVALDRLRYHNGGA